MERSFREISTHQVFEYLVKIVRWQKSNTLEYSVNIVDVRMRDKKLEESGKRGAAVQPCRSGIPQAVTFIYSSIQLLMKLNYI